MTPRDTPLLEPLGPAPSWPVFILGLHRSGTTLLYGLLARAARFNPVTTYHLACYDELLHNRAHGLESQAKRALDRRIAAGGRADRGIDHVAASADTHEEYAFLLLAKSGVRHLTADNLPHLRQLVAKVSYLADNQRSVLLKNPYDLASVPLLYRAFPGARFVVIHRHPLATLSSSVRALRTLLQTRSDYTAALSAPYRKLHDDPVALAVSRWLLSERHPLGATALALGAADQLRKSQRCLSALPPGRVVELRYEDLCTRPDHALRGILSALGEPAAAATDLPREVAPRRLALDRGVSRLAGPLHRLLRPYYERHGYRARPDATA